MQIIAISDTHGKHRDLVLPRGDVLVHAGDFTVGGEESATLDFVNWFSVQPFEHKIFIAGNHDLWAESHETELTNYARERDVHYLCNSTAEVAGLKFWGSPCTPQFMDWAFMYAHGSEAENQWSQVPGIVDVLVTHGPPQGILDGLYVAPAVTAAFATKSRSIPKAKSVPAPKADTSASCDDDICQAVKPRSESVGCEALAKRVMQVKPGFHIFGHIHEAFGSMNVGRTRFVNASVMNRHYQLANPAHQLVLSENDFADNAVEDQKFPERIEALVLDSVG